MREETKKSFLGSIPAKIIMIILLTVSVAGAVGTGYLTMYLAEYGAYRHYSEDEFYRRTMANLIWQEYYTIRDQNSVLDLSNMTQVERSVSDCVKLRLVVSATGEEVWSDYDGFYTPYTYTISTHYYTYKDINTGSEMLVFGSLHGYESKQYDWEFYIDPFGLYDSSLYDIEYINAVDMYTLRYVIPVIFAVSLILSIALFVTLMFSAGRRNGKSGISKGIFYAVPLDICAVVWFFAASCLLLIPFETLSTAEIANDIWLASAVLQVWAMLECLWGTAFAMECMTRLKCGRFWENTVICRLWRHFKKILGFLAKGIYRTAGKLPMFADNMLAYMLLCIVELAIAVIDLNNSSIALWFIGKLMLLPVIIYFSICSSKLKSAGKALAEGNLSYYVDTSKMILSQKEHGEDLNSIAKGINTAVEERMKSEHLKTELITNVSHDIKTPLTSIINYSDLICNEKSDMEKINEYAEVLNRQSMRLKKLLEDLLEASKASTGNLEVNMQPCDVGVMLTQTIGEYEHKFEEKQLGLVIKQPDTPICIMADSRHMWRIFDNLMNNIYKYAMEGTRVYLTVEKRENKVSIVFRNMSKYELNVSSEELTERFTRGDKSRHMEGHGLGLSIASSLATLQNGSMNVVTDGDLFKVILEFAVVADK
jgi:signal transduction histidine kinase